jgi:RND family efflux transporter MFP subunit
VFNEWVATLDGYVNAEIRPQVSGYIVSQNYKEGAVVRKGQVLFEIDPRPFQATLDSAKGELAQAEAQLAKSTIDVERDTPLVAQKAVPKEKLDNEIQGKRAAEAAVQRAKAAVERAELDLGWTKVTSLVDGIAGICEVQMGNLVGPSVRLTSVSQVDPIKVYFPVSEQQYLRAKHMSSTGEPMELFDSPAELILADGTLYPHKGRILLTDRQIDTSTGTIRLVAALNPAQYLGGAGTDYGTDQYKTGSNFPKGGEAYFTVPTYTAYTGSDYGSALPQTGLHRNSIQGPPYKSVDLSLAKAFALPKAPVLGESAKLEFRLDAYNVLNNLNLNSSSISNNIVNSNFGQATNALSGRVMTVGARFNF